MSGSRWRRQELPVAATAADAGSLPVSIILTRSRWPVELDSQGCRPQRTIWQAGTRREATPWTPLYTIGLLQVAVQLSAFFLILRVLWIPPFGSRRKRRTGRSLQVPPQRTSSLLSSLLSHIVPLLRTGVHWSEKAISQSPRHPVCCRLPRPPSCCGRLECFVQCLCSNQSTIRGRPESESSCLIQSNFGPRCQWIV